MNLSVINDRLLQGQAIKVKRFISNADPYNTMTQWQKGIYRGVLGNYIDDDHGVLELETLDTQNTHLILTSNIEEIVILSAKEELKERETLK